MSKEFPSGWTVRHSSSAEVPEIKETRKKPYSSMPIIRAGTSRFSLPSFSWTLTSAPLYQKKEKYANVNTIPGSLVEYKSTDLCNQCW